MMDTILTEMDRIRAQNGQDPINSFVIDGFTPGEAPPPLDWDRIAAANPASRIPEVEEAEPRAPMPQPIPQPAPPPPMIAASPLVALGEQEAPPPPTFHPRPLPTLDENQVAVLGRAASFLGQSVELTDAEHDSIGRIILEAAQRRLRGHLDRVRKAAPRRIRAKADPSPPAPVKRKPGRPKKSLPDKA